MSTLEDLIKQKLELERKIDEMRKEQRAGALSEVRRLIETHGFNISEVFGKKIKKASYAIPVKYRDPATGKTWSGMGRQPKWLEGKNREDFAV